MLELLREYELSAAFNKYTKASTEVRIAVPFWGSDAASLLAIRPGRMYRIICNLDSAACNPYVIRDLLDHPKLVVKTHRRLHAKMYLADHAVIIGSSNASLKGLTIGGESPTSWIEANLLSDDEAVLEQAEEFFEKIWTSRQTVSVKKSSRVLKQAILNWKNRSRASAAASTRLFDACRESPHLFRNVYIAAYRNGLDPTGRAKFRDFKASTLQRRGLNAQDFRLSEKAENRRHFGSHWTNDKGRGRKRHNYCGAAGD